MRGRIGYLPPVRARRDKNIASGVASAAPLWLTIQIIYATNSEGKKASIVSARRHAHLPGDRGPAGAMPQLRQGEARAARFPGGQPALYETLCPLRGPALSAGDDQGHCGGAEARLGYGQDV